MSVLRGAVLLAIVAGLPAGLLLPQDGVCPADEAGREETVWLPLESAMLVFL